MVVVVAVVVVVDGIDVVVVMAEDVADGSVVWVVSALPVPPQAATSDTAASVNTGPRTIGRSC